MRRAVLLCYPGVQEYNAAHWVFRRLAGLLTRAGYDVLRFDYFATGDSAGDGTEGRVGIWVNDVAQAAAELKELSGMRSLSIIGMRLGAALALRACAGDLRVRSLVLWEPVVSGAEYLSELDDLDRRRNLWLLHGDRLATSRDDLLGYRFPAELRQELLTLDACALRPNADRVVVVAEDERASYARLRESLTAKGVATTVRIVKDEHAPDEGDQRERAKFSHAALVEMVKELGQVAS